MTDCHYQLGQTPGPHRQGCHKSILLHMRPMRMRFARALSLPSLLLRVNSHQRETDGRWTIHKFNMLSGGLSITFVDFAALAAISIEFM